MSVCQSDACAAKRKAERAETERLRHRLDETLRGYAQHLVLHGSLGFDADKEASFAAAAKLQAEAEDLSRESRAAKAGAR